MLTYTGILKVKMKEVQVSEKFRKREFVLTDDAQAYPQNVLFQLTQDRCSLLDDVVEGQEVTVHFGLKGREWKNPQGEIKFFNSLDVFKVEAKAKAHREDNAVQEEEHSFQPVPDDDLPF